MVKQRWVSLVLVVVLVGCGKSYPIEQAIENGDIVTTPSRENVERFQTFLNQVNQKGEDSIRITSYTTEGDPIIQDVTYDGKQFSYSLDSSQDEFGNQADDRDGESCQALKKDQTDETHVYLLTDCAEGEDHPLLEATAAELGK
ncbi:MULTISPECIES: DUF4362 domain-containing protein [unclassified Exiguobacterium]|uniref:DUF4362 domain-containing protein n=1 Tax=unclassified Exiguobacterium TaxID=2644629 RepID=UPI001BE60B26|nr:MULTISPECIES: DUF4362 domain-containing protein [unclassified Exiguobacterium]